MSEVVDPPRLLEEVAVFLASQPSREELLGFRPSADAAQRAQDLLDRSAAGTLTAEETEELQQFEQTELLVRLIKAQVHQADHV
jgi:hypothetical protein